MDIYFHKRSISLLWNFNSEREKIEKIQATIKAEVQNLKRDEDLIGKKTSALAILYKKSCLVDRSKSDAVKIYLTYQIDLAYVENRTYDVKELKQELNESFLGFFRSCFKNIERFLLAIESSWGRCREVKQVFRWPNDGKWKNRLWFSTKKSQSHHWWFRQRAIRWNYLDNYFEILSFLK